MSPFRAANTVWHKLTAPLSHRSDMYRWNFLPFCSCVRIARGISKDLTLNNPGTLEERSVQLCCCPKASRSGGSLDRKWSTCFVLVFFTTLQPSHASQPKRKSRLGGHWQLEMLQTEVPTIAVKEMWTQLVWDHVYLTFHLLWKFSSGCALRVVKHVSMIWT